MQVKGVFYNKPVVTDNLELYLDAANINSFDSDDVTFNGASVNAQTAYTSSGTNSFVVPVGITSISAVCVGGGGGGGGNASSNTDAAAGGGGGLSYGTFAVTPGETLTIVVGAAGACANAFSNGTSGGNSQVKRGDTVLLQGSGGEGGGKATNGVYGSGGTGGASSGTVRDGGGTGGEGKNFPGAGAGGDGAGGGGGGAGANGTSGNSTGNNKGGGVGILGEGSNGAGGAAYNAGSPGSGGSGVTYGGGGGGAYRNTSSAGASGGVGAVRLVYQPTIGNRQYPTLANIADTTYSGPTNTWKDLTSSGHTITLNFSNFSSDNAGSLNFDGTDDYGTFNPGSDIAFGTGQFAVEIWANFVGEGPFYFIDTRNSSQTFGRWALYVNATEKLDWYTGSGATAYVFDTPVWDTGNNGWNHIVISREGTGSNQFKLYVNGAYVSAKTDSIDYTNSSTEASIGRRYSNSEFLDGKISVFKIYKGKALSASEVLQNYNALKKRYF